MFEELALTLRELRYYRLCQMIEEELDRRRPRTVRRDRLIHKLKLLVEAGPALAPEIRVLH